MTKRLGAGALALLLTACGGSSSSNDSFAAATPDVAGLVLETAPGANDGSAFAATAPTASTALMAAATTPAPTCQPWQYACKIHEGVRNFNLYVRAVVGPVEALATTTPTIVSDSVRVYGPTDVPATGAVATVKLTVKQEPGSALYRWKLEAKPIAADDAQYVVVMAGWLRKGDQPHRGAGALAIDLTTLASVAPSGTTADGFKGSGQILAAFRHVGEAKSLSFAVKSFIPDTTVAGAQPIDAAFVGHRTPSGETGVRLASVDELLPPASGTDSGRELLLARGRWVPGLGGRTAVVLTDLAGNDVSSYSTQAFHVDFLLGTSCWDRVDSGTEHEVFHGLFACRLFGMPHCVAVTPPASWLAAGFNPAAQDVSACRPGTDVGDETSPPDTSVSNRNPEPGGAGMVNGTNMAPDVSSIPSGMTEVRF